MADGENTLDDDDLVIEVDGKGVHLATLDARGVLELATAYIELLARIAEDNDEVIEFTTMQSKFPHERALCPQSWARSATRTRSPTAKSRGNWVEIFPSASTCVLLLNKTPLRAPFDSAESRAGVHADLGGDIECSRGSGSVGARDAFCSYRPQGRGQPQQQPRRGSVSCST